MAENATATTKKTTTRKGTTSKVKTAPKAQAVVTETPKEDTPVKLKVKELNIHDFVTVRNGFHGKLIFKSSRTGEKFTWDGFGDEQDIELQDLKAAKSAQKKFYEKNWFLFDDPAVITYLGVEQYYKNSLNVDDFAGLFELPVDEAIEKVQKIPASQKRTLAYFARQEIESGKLDSIRLVNELEKTLGVQLIER